MKAMKIYDRVLYYGAVISEQKFCECFNEAVEALINSYGRDYVIGGSGHFDGIEKRTDTADVYDEYSGAIVDYILALLGQADRFNLYERKAADAYLAVWRLTSKGRAVKPSLRGENHV